MPKCARTALASGLHTGPIIPSHPGDNLLFGTPQRPTQPRFPPIQPTHPFPVITYPTNHQSSHLSSQPLHTQSSNPYLPTTSVMITPSTCDMITSDNSSHSELTTTYKTTPSTVPLSSVNNSFDNFPPLQLTDPSPRVSIPSPVSTTPVNSSRQHDLSDPPVFINDPSYNEPPPKPIPTSQMMFHWPKNSSPDRTRQFVERAGGKLSPLNVDNWARYLKDYPDQHLVSNVLRGLREGFPIGFVGPRTTVESPDRDYSPTELQRILDEFDHEVSLGRMVGPLKSLPTTGPFQHYHRIHPTFLIPKKNSSKMRRIEHISWPPGKSVNDGIRKEDFPVNFTSIESMTEAILERDPGTYVSNYDITDAYRHLMLNPHDIPLFCFKVRDRYYLQLRVGFGGRSFPSIFDTMTHLTVWIITHHSAITGYPDSGIQRVEAVLDDLTTFHSDRATIDPILRQLEHERVMQIFEELGFPLARHKIQPPAVRFDAIGCHWDTCSQSVSIPREKLDRYKSKIDRLITDESVLFTYEMESDLTTSVASMRSLCGCLVYLCNICYVGRSRLYHLYKCLRATEAAARRRFGKAAETMKKFPGRWNVVHLDRDAIHDLRWWQAILPSFPCRLLLRRRLDAETLDDVPTFTTDASGWGVGGWYESTSGEVFYFSIPYSRYGYGSHSTYGELLAATVAVALWDHEWRFQHVRWITDCKPHVYGLFKIRTRAPHLLPLHDFLDMRSALGSYQYAPSHLAGKDNVIADQLSRGIVEVPSNWVRCRPVTDLLPSAFGTKLAF